jgi:hypothetical protein
MNARKAYKYIPMLSGVYFVSMVHVNDDASALQVPSTIFGWNLHGTTTDLDLDEPATTWFRYLTKQSTPNKLVLIFRDVREEVVGFQHARCAEALHTKQLLDCFERGLVIWNDINYTKNEAEYEIYFPSDIYAFVMVRAKIGDEHNMTMTGFEHSKEFVSSSMIFSGPTFIKATRRSLYSGTGFDYRLLVVHFSAQLERFVWDRGCT